MRNSLFAPMSAALPSVVAALLVILQMSTGRCDAAEDEPKAELPKAIVKDLAGAVWSQLTTEINKASAEKPTLVVWLVDKSASMSARRTELAERIERHFGKNGEQTVSSVLHAVAGFAKDVDALPAEPLADAAVAAKAIRMIKDDPSGEEHVMQAIESAAQHVRKMWTRFLRQGNCVVVIATDERGDDFVHVESIMERCSKLGIRVFCLGNASPFGVENGFVRWMYSDGFEQDIPVDSGPETVMIQVLNTPSLGGPRLELSRVSSGFGPYALARLCRETGGRFLIANDPADKRFAADIMEKYSPTSFDSTKEFQRSVKSNAAKVAVVEAVMQAR